MMRSAVPSVAWPPILTGQAATLASLIAQCEANERRSAGDIRRDQHTQLVKLATYAAQQSPFFRHRLDAAGLTPQDLGTPEGLSRLPVMTRRQLQQAGAALFCAVIPPSHLPQGELRSSGSTGEPVMVRKTALTQLFFQAMMMREHMWHKRDFSLPVLAIRGRVEGIQRIENWGPPTSFLYESAPFMALPAETPPAKIVRHMLDLRPGHLNTYPNILATILDHCAREGIRIDDVKHIWSIGETLKPELRDHAAAFFGAKIENDYSSNEMGIMALQCPDSGLLHEMAESVLLEVVDEQGRPCKNGERGRVVVTDLHNFATPLIRYDIGDVAERGGPCSCGRGLSTLNFIVGRKRSLAVKPDGVRHLPVLIPTHLAQLAAIPIFQVQVIQHALDDIETRLVAQGRLNAEEETKVAGHIRTALGYDFPVRFTYFEGRLPRPENGKFEDFISHLSPPD